MKRLVVLIPFVVLASAAATFAQSSGFKYIGGVSASYLGINESYVSGSGTETVSLDGVGFTSNFMTGRPLGVLGSVTLAYALNGSLSGKVLNMSSYSTRLLFNMLFGVGYRLHVAPKTAVLVGGGVSAVGVLLLASNPLNTLELAYASGVGALAQASYALTPSLEVCVNALGSYDPIAIENLSGTQLKSGFTYSAGIGVDVLY